MKKSLHVKIIMLASIFISQSLFAQIYNFDQLAKRITTEMRYLTVSTGYLDNLVASQTSAGAWAELNYGKLTTATATNTSDSHVLRLWQIAAACTDPANAKYNNTAYKNAVKAGLDYWYKSNTVDPSWWFTMIYFPQKLGETLIFMREFDGFIPKSSTTGIDETKVISLFKPTTIADLTSHSTGANEIDIALHYIYRGVLTKDSVLLQNTRDKVQSNIADNIKSDGVYQDHGPQIQIASYGWVLGDGFTRIAYFVAGTKAAFDPTNENFIKVMRFIRETQIPTLRGKQWDFGIMGRGVSRNNSLYGSLNYLKKTKEMLDPDNAEIYDDAMARIAGTKPIDYHVREFNKQYWNSDYMQHSRAKYLFTVRNVSTRTVEAETGNGENLKAHYLSNGANYISVDGLEYINIMPYWDWSMIPGTTVPYITTFPNRSSWGYIYGTTAFVGGVSDGLYGAATVNQSKAGTVAKKSWFLFDDEVVCLGAGITDNSGSNIRTTLNQHIMQTPSYIVNNGQSSEITQSVNTTAYQNTNLKYIRNGKVAYFFPESQNVKYTMKSQSGSWNAVNSNMSSEAVSGYVFSLWIDHGANPQNSTYSYIVVPKIESSAQAQAYNSANIAILSNTKDIQAVENKSLNIQQIVFHSAGSLTFNNMTVTVDKPCMLMLRNDSVFTVSDPSCVNTSIQLKLSKNGTQIQKNISLPTVSGMKGSSISTIMNIDAPTALNEPFGSDKNIKINLRDNKLNIICESSDECMIQLYTVSGQRIHSSRFYNYKNIEMETFAPGNYIVQVSNNTTTITQKVIIF